MTTLPPQQSSAESGTQPTYDVRFDLLKILGLLGVMLAHAAPPHEGVIFQFRNFDVTLLVMVSGAVFTLSSGRKRISYWGYLCKRIPRLIAPVWTFITLFLLIAFTVSAFITFPKPLTSRIIIESYVFMDGIGYLWIIRVYLLIALSSPLLLLAYRRLPRRYYLLMLLTAYLLYELLASIILPYTGKGTGVLINQYLFLLLPYSCVAGLGICFIDLPKKYFWIMAAAALLVFAGFAHQYYRTLHTFMLIDYLKYPPRIYYLSYGIFFSILLFQLSSIPFVQRLFNHTAVRFVSESSLWIYLWHILFLYAWRVVYPLLPAFCFNFLGMYIYYRDNCNVDITQLPPWHTGHAVLRSSSGPLPGVSAC